MEGGMTKQIRVFLGTEPRLLREMLLLALGQLLANAAVTEVDLERFAEQTASASATRNKQNGDAGTQDTDKDTDSAIVKGKGIEWLVFSAESSDSAEKQARMLFNRFPNLLLAAMGNDARSLNVYQAQPDGDVRETAYSDFSLAQLIDIFEQAPP